MTSPGLEALAVALRAENAAIFAYGIVEAFAESNAAMASRDFAAHRAWRDAITSTLTFEGADVPEAEAGYDVPVKVTDERSAAELAAIAETDTTTAWRAVAERAESDRTRQEAVTALTESAIRRARWRRAAGLTPSTTAFPGQP